MKQLHCVVVAWTFLCVAAIGRLEAAQLMRSTLVTIDAAPSVVAYQGSSETHARLVIAPVGRALGYIAPMADNETLPRSHKIETSRDVVHVTPVYIHNVVS